MKSRCGKTVLRRQSRHPKERVCRSNNNPGPGVTSSVLAVWTFFFSLSLPPPLCPTLSLVLIDVDHKYRCFLALYTATFAARVTLVITVTIVAH